MINGIEYLKKMYPNRDKKDYQPSGMDLRLGKVYRIGRSKSMPGLYDGRKILPKHKEVRKNVFTVYDDGKILKEIEGWELHPGTAYICEVDKQIKIGDNNAQFYLPRSSLLRAGVNVYTALGDLGYNGHLAFLVINHGVQDFFIEEGERFAQLIDFEVRGGNESYNGDYQEKEDF